MPKLIHPPITFAARLRQLRQAASLTQRDLAAAAGCSQQAVGHWERGIRRPTWDAICRIADALGVPVEEFR